jgi:hypothetical protein
MIMDSELEKYILNHSTPEDEILNDLYRQTHIHFVNPNMSCGCLQGKFLEMISRMISPDCILEIGTYTGYSSICLARVREWLSWWSTTLPRSGSRVRVPSRAQKKAVSTAFFVSSPSLKRTARGVRRGASR